MTAELLNRDDYFHCEKLACTMPKQTCMMRQEQALSFKEFVSGKKASPKRIDYAMCADCGQGKEIKELVAALPFRKEAISPARTRMSGATMKAQQRCHE